MKNLSGKILLALILMVATPSFAVESYHDSILGENDIFQGRMLINEWRIPEARSLAEKLIEDDPDDINNRYLMCLALFYSGDYEEALKYIDDDNLTGKDTYDLLRATYEQTRDFVRRESEHFIISYLPGKDEILVDLALEALEAAYKNLGADLGFFPESKKLVEIYPTIEGFTVASTLSEKDIETSGTIALCKFNRLMITSPRVLLRGYRWLRTLSHEYVHNIVFKLSRATAPIWFHEGVAKFLEDRFESDILGAMTPSSENALSRRLKDDTLITLEQMSPSMAYLPSGEDVMVAFAEVNSMIGYMVQLKGFDSIKDMLRLMGEGKKDAEAVEIVFGVTLEDFQENWKAHLKNSGLKEIPGMEISGMGVKLKSDEDISEEAIENEELISHGNPELKKYITLGNLLRDRGRLTAASFEYKKAYDEDPFSIIALTKLGYSYMLINKNDDAKKLLEEAIELYPDYVTPLYRLGMIHLKREEYEKSIEFFNESIAINPFIPSVRENLIYIYRTLGNDALVNEQQEILDKISGD